MEEVRKTEAAVLRTDDVLREKQLEEHTLWAVEEVLGLKGVRAHVLGHALQGVEAVANTWLPRLGMAGLSVQLRPYTENKGGGMNESISVVLQGAGGGKYKGASGGERRRVDLAILLGLCEVASAASGRTDSTLWFDELFDALDSDGVQAVVEALVDLSSERCIVVVTHNDNLAARIPAAMRWTIKNGQVQCR
jgi:DNA repair exonuclease SbcCD ATPase subunit